MLLLSFCVPFTSALSQAPAITATVDVAKTGTPISKNIYGQFLEHGGDIVNAGIWSEMLVDRKFFYPVATVAPTLIAADNIGGFRPDVIAVLNPSDAEQSIHLDIHGASLASTGKLWRMAPNSLDAEVKAGSPAEVQVEEQSLGTLPATVTLRPHSVNIYSYPVQ